jgi:flagellin
VQQLISEIDRISETTKFNGLQILDGTLGQVDLQAGADAYETIALEIGATDSATLGGGQAGDLVGTAASSLFDSLSLLGSVTINGQAVTSTVLNAATNGDEFIAAINSNVSGVEAATFVEKEGTQVGTGIIASGATNATITVEQNDGTNFVFAVEGTGSVEELVSAINEKSEGLLPRQSMTKAKSFLRLRMHWLSQQVQVSQQRTPVWQRVHLMQAWP